MKTAANPLTQVFFISTATHSATCPSTRELIEATRRRNPCNRITGLLLRTDRLYIQIAEGRDDAIDRLMQSIRRDPRHWDIQEWPKHRADHRDFESWQARQESSVYADHLAGVAQTRLGDLPFAALVDKLRQLGDPAAVV